MINLPTVTLCCADTRFPDLGFSAILRSTRNINFGNVIFFTSANFIEPKHCIPTLSIVRVEAFSNIDDYSAFMIKGVQEHISTTHCLVIQWDGFVIHPDNWDNEFLNYDYIGAPCGERNGYPIGNGGFSLRSKKLLTALSSEDILPHHPEDECICVTNRKVLEDTWGISFSPIKIAREFSFEFSDYEKREFGFHGFSNFPDVLDKKELLLFIDAMPEPLFVNEYFIGFCKKIFALQDNELISRISTRVKISLGNLTDKGYTKKQTSVLVEALLYLTLYKPAFSILQHKGLRSNWKSAYAKILIRRFFAQA